MPLQPEAVKCEGEGLTIGAAAVDTSTSLSSTCGGTLATAASTAAGDEFAKSDVTDKVSHSMPSSGAGLGHKTGENHRPLDLVLCFEQCHKPDFERQRERIRQGAKENGALLVMLKKSYHFARWLKTVGGPAANSVGSPQSPVAAAATCGGEFALADAGPYRRRQAHGALRPYVLLASWREAKPCLEALVCNSWPLFMVVVCSDSTRSLANALAWAAGLNSFMWGQVWVTDSWETGMKIVARQMRSFLSNRMVYSPPNAPPCPMWQPIWEPQGLGGTDFIPAAWTTPPTSLLFPDAELTSQAAYPLPLCSLLYHSTSDELSETLIDALPDEKDCVSYNIDKVNSTTKTN